RGILDVARANATASAAVMLDALHDRLRGFSAGAPPRDDVTVVVCRIGGRQDTDETPGTGSTVPQESGPFVPRPIVPDAGAAADRVGPYAPESARQPVSSTRGVQ
ncbi:MAG TPA: hypothetical protein VND21_05250, partial [Planctomycetota bacterium]|nr:hypothetical protein [Planctomycetota bacterium]